MQMQHELTSEQIASYRENGFLVIENFSMQTNSPNGGNALMKLSPNDSAILLSL